MRHQETIVEAVKEGLRSGERHQDIADSLNIPRSSVSAIARRSGLARRGARRDLVVGNGYEYRYCPSHQKASAFGYVPEHILVVEKALGRAIPDGAIVHHVNGDKADNRPQNLVLCESDAYHLLLHQRQRALDECGNPSWRKCRICGKYDDPENLWIPTRKKQTPHHRSCLSAYERARRAKKKQQ